MVSKEFIEKEWIKAYNALNPFLDVNGHMNSVNYYMILRIMKNSYLFQIMLIMPVLLNLMN